MRNPHDSFDMVFRSFEVEAKTVYTMQPRLLVVVSLYTYSSPRCLLRPPIGLAALRRSLQDLLEGLTVRSFLPGQMGEQVCR